MIRKQLITSSVWLFFAKVGAGLSQLLAAAILARLLTPEEFGGFQVIQRIVILGSILGSFGLGWVMVRLVAEGIAHGQPKKSHAAALNIIKLVFLFGFSVSAMFLFYYKDVGGKIFGDRFSPLTIMTAVMIIIGSMQQVIPEFFRGIRRAKEAAIFSGFATSALFFMCAMFVITLDVFANLESMVLLNTMSMLMMTLLAVLILSPQLVRLNVGDIDGTTRYREIFLINTPIFFSTILLFLVSNADVWIVAILSSARDAAIYGAASRMVFLLSLPMMVANSVIKPLVSEYLTLGKTDELEILLRKTANMTILFAMPLAFMLLYWTKEILTIIYGGLYSEGTEVLRVLIIGHVGAALLGPCSVVVIMAGRQLVLLAASLISAAAFALLLYNLFPKIGVVGVAWSVSMATVVMQAVMTVDVIRHLKIKTYVRLQ